MPRKPSMGRRKIGIAKIEDANQRRDTFYRRRSGLFKKASELCTLCGVEIAVVAFSPTGKVFSFGEPNVDALADRFLTQGSMPSTQGSTQRSTSIQEDLNKHLTSLLDRLEAAKKKGKELDRMKEERLSHCWWENPINTLGLAELEKLRPLMENLKVRIADHVKKVFRETHNKVVGGSGTGSVSEQHERKPHVGLITSSSSPGFHPSDRALEHY